MKNSPLVGIPAAIRALDRVGAAGTLTLLAKRNKVSRQTIYDWIADGIPPQRLPRLMSTTGLGVAVLRPDYRQVFKQKMGISPEQFFSQQKASGAGRRKK